MKTGHLLLIATTIVTAGIFTAAKALFPPGDVWQLLAQGSGIFGLYILCWTYLLAIRHTWLEKLFGGLDRVYWLHHLLGGTSALFLVHHPLFMIIRQLPANTLSTYLLPTGMISYALGIYALYALLILTILTLYVDMPYKIWKQTHEWMGIVIILGAWHGLIVSSDMSKFLPLTIWMSICSAVAVGAYIYKRFVYYSVASGATYTLDEVLWEKDMVVVTLKAKDASRAITFGPGQFGFISFDTKGRVRDEHPFSIVYQDGDMVCFGIKVTGGFTLALAQASKGTRFKIHGPFGSFGNTLHVKRSRMLWIAGGIGVTPFLSFLRTVSSEQQVTFILTVRGSGPGHLTRLIYQSLTRLPHVTFYIHDTHASGRLTAERIAAYAPIEQGTRVWLCGPQAMMTSLSEQLPTYGVLRKHICFEDFTFR